MRDRTKYRRTTRWAALAGAMIMATAGLAAVQLAAAAPATAVPGLNRAVGASLIDSASGKSATAFCQPGERVVGGGGRVQSVGAYSARIALTQLLPVHSNTGTALDRFIVSGAETSPGTNSSWRVLAFALCAPASQQLSGYNIVESPPTLQSSQPRHATSVSCPGAQVALGTGGRIINPGGEVALQVARASIDGRLARVQAHEEADGYSGSWSVVAYAVCVDRPPGYEIVTGLSDQEASESIKFAEVSCPDGKQVHGVGAAVTDVAPGHVSLREINTLDDIDRVKAFAQEHTPTSQNWDFIVVRAVCAY